MTNCMNPRGTKTYIVCRSRCVTLFDNHSTHLSSPKGNLCIHVTCIYIAKVETQTHNVKVSLSVSYTTASNSFPYIFRNCSQRIILFWHLIFIVYLYNHVNFKNNCGVGSKGGGVSMVITLATSDRVPECEAGLKSLESFVRRWCDGKGSLISHVGCPSHILPNIQVHWHTCTCTHTHTHSLTCN